jgi:hypothetical protein
MGGLLNIQQHDVQWHVRLYTLLIPHSSFMPPSLLLVQHILHIDSDTDFLSLSNCYIAFVAVRNILCWRLTFVAVRNVLCWRLTFVAVRNVLCWCLTFVAVRNVLCWCLTFVRVSISIFGAPGTLVV